MDQSAERRVALVTGASRGIGRAIAERLAEEHYTVIGTATSETGAASVAAYLEAVGNPGTGKVLRVDDDASVAELIASINAEFGAVAVLVNNAGITRDNLLMRMKDEEWSAVVDTNLTALFRLCKACSRGMTRAKWGRIITITSVVGSMGNPGQSNYAATKAGAEGFSRALARELGSRAITVNCVAPGFIDTDMTRELPEDQRLQLQQQIPLNRFGAPEEIAAAVAFLASEQAGYITGTTIHVNGGMHM